MSGILNRYKSIKSHSISTSRTMRASRLLKFHNRARLRDSCLSLIGSKVFDILLLLYPNDIRLRVDAKCRWINLAKEKDLLQCSNYRNIVAPLTKIGIFLDDYYLEKEHHEYVCGRNAFRGDFSRTKIINC